MPSRAGRSPHVPPLTLALLLWTTACSSWHVQSVSPAQLVADAHPSRVRVQRSDGSRVVLQRPVVRGDSLAGQGAGDSVAISFTDIGAVETRRFDVAKTGGLVAVLFLVPAIACAATCEFGPGFSFSQ